MRMRSRTQMIKRNMEIVSRIGSMLFTDRKSVV